MLIGEHTQKTLESGKLGFGDKVEEFENEFEKFSKKAYNIGFNSATSAFYAYFSWLAEEGSIRDITTPTLGFASPAWCAYKNGFNVKFTDLNNDSNFLPVNYGGNVNWGHRAAILDNAHAITESDIENVVYSFHPTKPISMSQGGILSTNSVTVAQYCRKFRNFGRANISGGSYDIVSNGSKSYMTNLDASLGLDCIETKSYLVRQEERKTVHGAYRTELEDCGVLFMQHREDSSYYLTTALLPVEKARYLREGLGLPFFYPLLHRTSFWTNLKKQPKLPKIEKRERFIINLPTENISEKRFDEIVNAIKKEIDE